MKLMYASPDKNMNYQNKSFYADNNKTGKSVFVSDTNPMKQNLDRTLDNRTTNLPVLKTANQPLSTRSSQVQSVRNRIMFKRNLLEEEKARTNSLKRELYTILSRKKAPAAI